jgi:type I restriction enzyme S subunit
LIDDGALMVSDGYRAKNRELGFPGLPFARAGNVNKGFDFRSADHLREELVPLAGKKIALSGDVVFTSKGTVGRFAFVAPTTPLFVYSPQLCFWRVLRREDLVPRFVYFWMSGNECRRQFYALKGQTDMADYISLRDQRTITVTAPPVAEQTRIVAALGGLDDKIASNRRLTDLSLASLSAAFRYRVSESGDRLD